MTREDRPYLSGSVLGGSPPPGVLPIAHRGGARRWPENTALAFEAAIALGYTLIETDVQLTRDGAVVVFHDANVERTTDGRGEVRDLSLAEIRALDAGFRFTRDGRTFPYRDAGVRVSTLEEILAAFPNTRFNLELKGLDPDLPARVHELIETLAVHDRVLVASAHDVQVERFRERMGRRVATSAGAAQIRRFWFDAHLGLRRDLENSVESYPFDALQVPFRHGRLTVVDRRFLDHAQHHGIYVHVWTIDDPREMRALVDLGVDGIMTDRPEKLLEILANHPRAGL